MRRLATSLLLPLILAVSVGGSLHWLLEPRPRTVLDSDRQQCLMEFSPDGSTYLVSRSSDYSNKAFVVSLVDLVTGKDVWSDDFGNGAFYRLEADGAYYRWTLVPLDEGRLAVYRTDPRTGVRETIFDRQVGPHREPWLANDGRTLTFVAEAENGDNHLEVWDVASQQRRFRMPSVAKPLLSHLSPDGGYCVTSERWGNPPDCTQSYAVRLYDTRTGEEQAQELPRGTMAVGGFNRNSDVLELNHHSLLTQSDALTGLVYLVPTFNPPILSPKHSLKPYFESKRVFCRDPARDLFAVASAKSGVVEAVRLDGTLLGALSLPTNRSLTQAQFVPNTTLIAVTWYQYPTKAAWLRTIEARIGRVLVTSQSTVGVTLFDWTDGRTVVERGGGAGPFGSLMANCTTAADGRRLAISYHVATGSRVEIWDLPIRRSPAWLPWFVGCLAGLGVLLGRQVRW